MIEPSLEWVFGLFLPYFEKAHKRQSEPTPQGALLELAFFEFLSRATARLMVQEPWSGTIRFKLLAVYRGPEAYEFLRGAEKVIPDKFGSGKFKVNIYDGLHFVGTRNFKPQGLPELWRQLPESAAEGAE